MRSLRFVWMICVVQSAQALDLQGRIDAGVSRNLQDMAISDHSEFTVRLEAEDHYDKFYWVAAARYREDSWDAIASDGERTDHFDWRDLYVGTSMYGWDFALGWQQVVWGRADELRVIDQVNPEDLREFILPELSERRLAIPMLKVNGYISDWELEILYIPEFRENRQAAQGAEFSLFSRDPVVAAMPVIEADTDSLGDEAGLRVSRQFGRFDFSAVALRSYDDNPVYRLVMQAENSFVLQEEFHRYDMLGASTSFALGGHVIRAEVARNLGMSMNTASSIATSDVSNWLIGWDYLIRDWMVTFQYNDRLTHDWQADFSQTEDNPLMTLSLQGIILDGKLEARISHAQFLAHGEDSLFQIQSTYSLSDHLKVELALDLLSGERDSLMGQFADSDRIKMTIGYLLP